MNYLMVNLRHRMKRLYHVALCALMIGNTYVYAQSSVVVIPLFGGEAASLANVITVSRSGGDFTDPVSALNSITDNEAGNTYIIMIGPGIYDLTEPLVMKPFVNFHGSGKFVTLIRGARAAQIPGPDAALVIGGPLSKLSNLSISNGTDSSGNPVGKASIGIYSNADNPELNNVTISATGGLNNYAMYNVSARPVVKDSQIFAGLAGTNGSNYGVYNTSFSHAKISRSEISVGHGKNNYGVYNINSSPRLDGVRIIVESATSSNQGILNNGGSPEIINSYILADDNGARGMRSDGDSEPRVRRTTIYAGIQGNSGTSTSVSQSSVFGTVVGSGNFHCTANDNTFGTPLDQNCQPLP